MKKLLIVLATCALLIGLGVAVVQADINFPNNTEVQSWANSAIYNGTVDPHTYVSGVTSGNWYDVIGAPSVFETTGATLSGSKLTINTNWSGPSYVDSFAGYTAAAVTADLFIKSATSATWDYAIALGSVDPVTHLSNTRMDTVYVNPTYNTSQTYFNTSGLIFGGLYNTGTIASPTGALVPVFATGVNTGGSITQIANLVDWSTGDPVIDLSLLAALGFDINAGWSFLWGTGTCANDAALGSVTAGAAGVPLPGALVLLGAGLVRLAAYSRRRRIAV